ncbi:MAG: ribbon-helix-helix domain-containing protein [Methylobacter sp.]
MNRVRWSVVVPESTDKALRTYLAGTGMKKGDISHFVDEAVQLHLFDLVTGTVKARNKQFNQDDILAAIDEAVSSH